MLNTHDFALYNDMLIFLGVAALLVPLGYRFKIPAFLTFMLCGLVLQSSGLGQLIKYFDPLKWVILTDKEGIKPLAELGVVFLMFVIALELTFKRLTLMWKFVFGLGGAQVIITTFTLATLLIYFKIETKQAIVLASCLALSSTAGVIDLLTRNKRMNTMYGRLGFSILLFQDLAVVPIIFMTDVFVKIGEGSLLFGLLVALAKGAFIIITLVFGGKIILRPLFRFIASSNQPEFLIAASLFITLFSAAITTLFGLSMGLGAFIAGLLLAETEYRKAIETVIEPFKNLLLGLFFFSIGLNIDFKILINNLPLIIVASLSLIIIKAFIIYVLARGIKINWLTALHSALLLSAGGEFAFVIIGIGLNTSFFSREIASIVASITLLTMALIPLLDMVGLKMAKHFTPKKPIDPRLSLIPHEKNPQALVVGYGRVGQVVVEMLAKQNIESLAVDNNVDNVSMMRKMGHEVYYGEVDSERFLYQCDLTNVKALIITIYNPKKIDAIIAAAKNIKSDIQIIVRARDADHAVALYKKGVTYAVPEAIEASLQLTEASLLALGVHIGKIIPAMHDKRDEYRKMLSQE